MVALGTAIIIAHFRTSTTSCWLKTVYGRDCIICGCTRDFFDILSAGGPVRNKLSTWLMGGVVVEFIWRLLVSFVRVGRLAVICDILLHVVVIGVLFTFNLMIILGLY